MAKTNSFKIAELIRAIEYDVTNDVIVTSKIVNSKTSKAGSLTTTATTEATLDTFAHASFRAARYVIAMKEGSDYHSTEVVLVHDGSAVTMTAYGTLKSSTLATFDADINGANVELKITPSSASSTVTKFDRTLIEA